MSKTDDLYSMVTDRIISEIEKGGLKWLKGWTTTGLPVNGLTNSQYRGINTLWLMMEIKANDYKSNRFYTFRQVKGLRGNVIAGSKGVPVFFYKPIVIEVEDKETGELVPKTIPLMRSFVVFNQDQTTIKTEDDGEVKTPVEKIKACEDIAGWSDRPDIQRDFRAYYSPLKDIIGIPDMEDFHASEGYYATLFHEMIHSTGARSRLNREGIVGKTAFGSGVYSVEEVIAELGSSMLCAKAGIFDAVAKNSSAYVQNWLKSLRQDKRFIFKVMSKVQASVDLITGEGRKV